MFSYQFHIGDFNNASRCLTPVERWLYRDLLDIYYDTEKPLTSDMKMLKKLAMVNSDELEEALCTVLGMFFSLEEDGYHNKRCDEEIQEYHAFRKRQSNAGKASAEARMNSGSTKSNRRSTGVQQRSNRRSTNHKPLTINHNTPSKDPPREEPEATQLADQVIDYLNARAGRSFRRVDSNRRGIRARMKDGATLVDCRRVIDNRVMRWAHDDKMVEYLNPVTIFRPENFQKYLNDPGGAHEVNRPNGGNPPRTGGRSLTPAERTRAKREAIRRDAAGEPPAMGTMGADE